MTEPPSHPPHLDWESLEFGEAIRAYLDAHAGMLVSPQEQEARWERLGVMVRADPRLVIGASMAVLNAALSLPAMMPAIYPNGIREIREALERQVYEDIKGMDPPSPPG